MQPVVDTLRLIRFFNCLLTSVGVWVGAYLTWGTPVYYGPLMASVAAFLVCAAGNCINDVLDIEIDRVNRPRRVLPQGRLSVRFAVSLAALCGCIALMVAWSVNWPVTITVVAALILLLAYNFRLKHIPLLGNFVVAVLGGLTFVTGGLAVKMAWTWQLPGPLIPAIFALLFHLVREILKDVEDLEGDRQAGIRTLPQVVGPRPALGVALGLFVVLTVLTLVPVLAGWFGPVYKVITVYIIDLPLLVLLIVIWGNPSPRMLAVGSLGLKIGMALGVVALVLA